jgi:D-serine deaminase-like pyridoxal phosphate-dependent protein
MRISDLPTPAVLIEKSRLEENLRRMQSRADAAGVRLRPHAKTHKCVEVARLQQKAGASGITVSKPSEAEPFASGGFQDIRIAYPLCTPHHFERVAALQERTRISFCLDTPEAADAASSFFRQRSRPADVLLELDCGFHRTGVPWDDPTLPELAHQVASLPGLRLRGILSHAGQAYHGPGDPAADRIDFLKDVSRTEVDRMLEVAVRLRDAGVPGAIPGKFELSVGSTPTMTRFENRTREGFSITEVRPGNYVFHDAGQVALGSADWSDCALTVLASVVSRRRDRTGRERVFLDAGRKVLTSDTSYGTRGYGVILHSPSTMKPLPHVSISRLSEEHGWVDVAGGSTLAVGDQVRIVPNHACVVVNTQNLLYLVDGEEVVGSWKVDARGCSH